MMGEDKIQIILSESESYRDAKKILREFLIEYARKYITGRTNYFALEYGFEFKKIAIKDQRSRWGSCSSLRNLNFNWRLIFAHSDIADYVVIHELAHTQQMNHSADFWNLVGECMPNYKEHRRWLKENGLYLLKMF